jgi:hypothetical protein
MEELQEDRSFGTAWLLFALAFAAHVADEATHDFLSTYNSTVRGLRARLPWLPVPTFTFTVWLSLLIAGFILLLCASPAAFHGNRQLKLLARPLAVLAGISNAVLHLAGSLYLRRFMPGVYSSPALLVTGLYLLRAARFGTGLASSFADSMW